LPSRNIAILLQVYLAQRAALKRLLTARLGNEDEAEDVVQELYFRIERGRDTKVDSPPAYLFRMALNLARDHQRERQRSRQRDGRWVEATQQRIDCEPIAPLPAADSAYAAKQRLERLVAALDDLSPQCRRVFVLHKFDGLSHGEIAARVGIARSTVEKHMTTALRHLTARLGRG
jgi:RNA polymerase sigma factor (sigma-70 family)